MKKNYTKTNYEVHTSADGDRWYRIVQSWADSPEGLKAAEAEGRKLSTNARHVRLAHVTRKVRTLWTLDNFKILSPRQTDELLSAGKKAIAGLAGLVASEGFSIDLSSPGLAHDPVRVTISFSPEAAMGKRRPKRVALSRGNYDPVVNEEIAVYDAKCALVRQQLFGQASHNLREASVRHEISEQEITLLWTEK